MNTTTRVAPMNEEHLKQRVAELERVVIDMSYDLYVLALYTSSVCGTDILKTLEKAHVETTEKLKKWGQ